MGEEKRKFRIRVKIVDSDGQIKELVKVAEIKINFDGNQGRAASIPKLGEGGDLVRFKKDGKTYNIIVRIDEVKKTWWRDKPTCYGFSLPHNSSFTLYEDNDTSPKSYSIFTRSWAKPPENSSIVAIQWRWKGLAILCFFFILVFVCLIIWWKKERKK